MNDCESLSHSKWECKYHVVFIPNCRRKTLYLELRRHLGNVFRKLAEQKESKIEEGHEKKRNFVGQHFWAREYFILTVGRHTEVIREYIKKQEEEATFRWPTRSGAASAAPTAASSGSQPKAPGSAGGYLP